MAILLRLVMSIFPINPDMCEYTKTLNGCNLTCNGVTAHCTASKQFSICAISVKGEDKDRESLTFDHNVCRQ